MPDAPFAGAASIWFQYGEFMNKEDCCIVLTIKPCMQTGQFTIECEGSSKGFTHSEYGSLYRPNSLPRYSQYRPQP